MRGSVAFAIAATLSFGVVYLVTHRRSAVTTVAEEKGAAVREPFALARLATHRDASPDSRRLHIRLQQLAVADDDATAHALVEGVGHAGLELLRAAWLEHVGSSRPEPADCFPEAPPDGITLRLHVHATTDLVIVRDARVIDDVAAAVKECIDAWFAGESTITADQQGTAFPHTEVFFDVYVPTVLGPYVAE